MSTDARISETVVLLNRYRDVIIQPDLKLTESERKEFESIPDISEFFRLDGISDYLLKVAGFDGENEHDFKLFLRQKHIIANRHLRRYALATEARILPMIAFGLGLVFFLAGLFLSESAPQITQILLPIGGFMICLSPFEQLLRIWAIGAVPGTSVIRFLIYLSISLLIGNIVFVTFVTGDPINALIFSTFDAVTGDGGSEGFLKFFIGLLVFSYLLKTLFRYSAEWWFNSGQNLSLPIEEIETFGSSFPNWCSLILMALYGDEGTPEPSKKAFETFLNDDDSIYHFGESQAALKLLKHTGLRVGYRPLVRRFEFVFRDVPETSQCLVTMLDGIPEPVTPAQRREIAYTKELLGYKE